jgi:hypothetical protein
MAFATVPDIANRLGRELTDSEQAYATDALITAASIIGEAAGKDDAWADALDPVPRVLRELSIDMVVRAGQNPEGLQSTTETLGQYSVTERFNVGDSAGPGTLFLSDEESRMCRRVINGPGSSTALLPGLIDAIPEQPLPPQMMPPLIDTLSGADDSDC